MHARTLTLPLALLTVAPLAVAPASAAPSPFAPGTRISFRTSQQVMVADRTRGTRGTWARYEWRGTRGWVRLDARSTAIFGSGGVVPAARRVQDTNTTPAGTFGFVSAFGVGGLRTKLPYRRVTRCSWWVEDPASSLYNRWTEHCGRVAKSEHLADETGSLYRQAAVMDYNYRARVRRGPGSGAGIFLHYATRHTGGCVGLANRRELNATIAWIDPAKHPLIVVKA